MFNQEAIKLMRERKCSPELLQATKSLIELWKRLVFRGEMRASEDTLKAFKDLLISMGDEENAEHLTLPSISMAVGLRTMVVDSLESLYAKEPIKSIMDVDWVDFYCPCGETICVVGKTEKSKKWFEEHEPHSNRTIVQTLTEEALLYLPDKFKASIFSIDKCL